MMNDTIRETTEGVSSGSEQAFTPSQKPRGSLFFNLYVAFLVLLPAGSLFGVNVKMLVFVPVALFALEILFTQKDALRQLAVCVAVLGITLGWMFIAQLHSFYSLRFSIAQLRDVTTTFAGCWFIRLYTLRKIDRRNFVKFCLYVVTFGGFLKLLIFSYSLGTGVSVSTIMDGVTRLFGVKLMTFELGDAGGRIQYPSDTLIPVCLFAILCLRKKLGIGGFVSLAMIVCLLASSIFTFSRYLWIYTVVGVVLGMLAGRKDRMHLLYLGGTGLMVAYSFNIIVTLVILRFSNAVVDSSDASRTDQKGPLVDFFKDAPFFGHGLGSYTWLVIRDSELYYNYEMQIVALAGQVGLIGIVLLLAIIVNYYRKAFTFERGGWIYQAAVLTMLFVFLLAGFFNPYLVSSIAAATFGLLFALAAMGSCDQELVHASVPKELHGVSRKPLLNSLGEG